MKPAFQRKIGNDIPHGKMTLLNNRSDRIIAESLDDQTPELRVWSSKCTLNSS